jgi:cyanobactin maturation PatA/PatG family protease
MTGYEVDRMTTITSLPGLRGLQQFGLGDPGIRVAILDGPADTSHPCLQGAAFSMLETLIPHRAESNAATRHGTQVASIIFGQPGTPILGIAPRCRGLLGPIFGNGADLSSRPCSQLDLARAITLALEAGAHIISVSGGQFSPDGIAEPRLLQAIRLCEERNVLVIAAAGNDGCACLNLPAAVPSVLAVGAMDDSGAPLEISNWGAAYRINGVLAPGANIPGAVPGGGIARSTGTSFATAIVAGVAALLLSFQVQCEAEPDPRLVREAILGGATPCGSDDEEFCSHLLAGRLCIVGALNRLRRETPPPSTPVRDKSSLKGEPPVQSEAVAQVIPAASSCEAAAAVVDPPPSCPGNVVVPASAPAVQEGVAPSGCGCGGQSRGPYLVYGLGLVAYDFGTEARRDSLIQQGLGDPGNAAGLLTFLEANPDVSTAVIWLLTQDATPIYAINPAGPYAAQAYERLRQFLNAQLNEGVEQVSIPGYAVGTSTLMNGQVVPNLIPELRGMYSWSTPKLVQAVAGPPADEAAKTAYQEKVQDISNFLERVYYEVRNLGVTAQDRAMNFAATNAYQVQSVFESAVRNQMKLDAIGVDKSPICRPNSDCWDVTLTFFDPTRRFERAKHVYRFTVDVSDVIPVTVGKVRNWDVY